MKFKSHLSMHAPSAVIRREPGFWESFTTLFGAEPDLATSRVRANLKAAQLLSGVKKALERCGVVNAIALTVDHYVLFEDKAGRQDDLVDLFTAFYKNEVVYGRDFKELVLAVEHTEAGVHYVIELEARSEHEADEATVRLVLSGRINEFQPRAGEDAKTFRQRVTPHLESPAFTEVHRLQFESFVARIRDGLAAGLPEVKVSEATAVVEAVRPTPQSRRVRVRPAMQRTRDDRRYDPFDRYYPRSAGGIAERCFWNAMVGWDWHPSYHVVDMAGHTLGLSDSMPDLAPVAFAEGFDFAGRAASGSNLAGVGAGLGDTAGGLGETSVELGDAAVDLGDVGAGLGNVAADLGDVGASLGDAADGFDFFDIDLDFF